MKQQLRKFHFTLVEVLIAMGICVVGVVSVMGLFPVGANAARDASMNFYADQAAEQMLNFTKFAVLNAKDGSNDFSPEIFKSMTGGWTLDDTATYFDNTRPAAADEPHDWSAVAKLSSDSKIQDYLADEMATMLTNSDTVIQKYSWKLYRIGFLTQKGDNKIEDFACIVRLWATPVYANELDKGSLKLPRIATFHVEVSWPADLAYDRRQKAEYSLDVFVPAG